MAEQLTTINDDYVKRLQALQAQQAAADAATQQQAAAYGQQRVANYPAFTGGTSDIQNQGFGGLAPGLAQQQAVNQQAIANQNARQQQLSAAMTQYGAGTAADRIANAGGMLNYHKWQGDRLASQAAAEAASRAGSGSGGNAFAAGQAADLATLEKYAKINAPGGTSYRKMFMDTVGSSWARKNIAALMDAVEKDGSKRGFRHAGATVESIRDLWHKRHATLQGRGITTMTARPSGSANKAPETMGISLRGLNDLMRRFVQFQRQKQAALEDRERIIAKLTYQGIDPSTFTLPEAPV